MMVPHLCRVVCVVLICALLGLGSAPAAEPLPRTFSAAKAAQFLDAGARAHEEKCTTCHGTLAYLLARPALPAPSPKLAEVRAGLEKFVAGLEAERLIPDSHPRRIAQTVMAAAALAHQDAATTGKLQSITRQALDRMWQVQQPDGGYKWLKPNAAPPSAVEDHFGVTMAAIAAGWAPGEYRHAPAARAGLEKARRYLREHPPQHAHQRAMLLLADHGVGGLLDDAGRRAIVCDLLALERPDGGWAMGSLGRWTRKDGQPQDLTTSDGYGTGFVVYVLRTAGAMPSTDARIRRALDWLKTHQRADGGWYTRSPRNSDELSSYLGTVYAVLALDACGEVPKSAAGK
jgi:squalene-hopene/tetraprenyl-beta-curcumene cyclase